MSKLEISKVHDAYRASHECPLCLLIGAAEHTYLQSFQGSRVMEPSVRVKTNALGFCPDHYRKLYQGDNKLGLSLMVHTHLKEKLPELRSALEALRERQGAPQRRPKGELAARMAALAESLERLRNSCFLCEMLQTDLDRYVFTIVYLWRGDAEFLPGFRASRGFCLKHFAAVAAHAQEALRGEELTRFLDDVVPLMVTSLQKLEADLFGFTQLFHDANRSLGGEDERTALLRALQKLSGTIITPEDGPGRQSRVRV